MSVQIAWPEQAGLARPLDEGQVAAAVERALEHGGRAGLEVSVVFTTDAELARLHREWLDDAAPTDVIAFDLGEDLPGPAAELYVSLERARLVAAERGGDAGRELALYLVHGALHLCGYDDREPAERRAMRAAEGAVLAELGYPPEEPF